MNLGLPIIDRLIDMEINNPLEVMNNNYVITNNIKTCSQHFSCNYVNMIIRRFKAIAFWFNINIESYAIGTSLKLYMCSRDCLMIKGETSPLVKIKNFDGILDKHEFKILMNNIRYPGMGLKYVQMYDNTFPISKIDNFFGDSACKNIKYQYDMCRALNELLTSHKLECGEYTTRGGQLKHVFQNWYGSTIKQKQYNKGVVLMDYVSDIYNRNLIVEETICKNTMACRLHNNILKICKSISDNILLNSLFFNAITNKPIEQFIIYHKTDKSNNTISYYMSNSSFVGLSFNYRKNKLFATSCIRIEFNEIHKTYHFYPYIGNLPDEYKNNTLCTYSYYKEMITKKNFDKIIKNCKNENDALINLIVYSARQTIIK